MPPKPPPPASTGQSHSQNAALNDLLKRFHGYRQYMPIIRAAAARWGMDPVLLLATLAWENGKANAGIRNSAGARGLAQIVDARVGHFNPQQYASFIAQFAPDGRITDARAFNPTFAINYMAWRMVGHIRQYGSLNGAYSRGYNPGFTGDKRGRGPAAYVPGWYWAQSKIGASPADVAGRAASNKQAGAQQAAGNPFLVGQQFLYSWHHDVDPIYLAYAGRPATRAEAKAKLAGMSDYQLQIELAGRKSFIGSPIWKTQAPGYIATYRQIYGDKKPDPRLVAFAIIHNLGSTGFAEQLREGKSYVKSTEFAAGVATLQNVYQSVFGHPDANGLYVIKQATIHQWTPDQFASYLRAQPEYRQSAEFRNNAAQVAQVFGGQSTMTAAEALNAPAPTANVPRDPRLGPAPWETQPPPAKKTKPPPPARKTKPGPAPKPIPVPAGAGGQQP